MDAKSMRRMQVALTPADRKLALDSVSSRSVPLEGVIDLTSSPDEVGAVSMEDDRDNHTYVQDIPGVRSLGIKRHGRNLAHTAPQKTQRFTPSATNSELLQVKKTLQFSTAENPVVPLVKVEMETCVSSQEIKKEAMKSLSSLSDWGSIGKKEKLKDIAEVIEEGDLLPLYKNLNKQVAGHLEEIMVLKAKISEKDIEITKLRKDLTHVSTEKETLKEEVASHVEENKALNEKTSEKDGIITKLRKDLTDIHTDKKTRIKTHSKEIEDLKSSFRLEKAELEGGNKVYRDLLTESNGLISQQSGEIEVLKTSFSALKSKVSNAFMEVETQNRSSNAETCGQSSQQ